MNEAKSEAGKIFRRVSFEGTALVLDIEEDDTLLGGILRSGVGVPYECNAGGCGSCKYTLIDGDVIDDIAESAGLRRSDRRKNKHLACISHVRSDCTIQIKSEIAYKPKYIPKKIQSSLQSIQKLTHDLWEFRFNSDRPAQFLPGQYAKVYVPNVSGPRSYSMSNTANESGEWKFQIKQVPGGEASSVLFGADLSELSVTIDAPYSIAHLQADSTRNLVCVAGGSGLAPMVSILRGNAELRGDTSTPVLYYGARSVDDVIDPDYFSKVAGFDSKQQYVPIVSEPDTVSQWRGVTGFVHEHLAVALPDDCSELDFYIAGPPPMVDSVRRHLVLDRGISVNQLHYDRFY